MFPDGRLDLTGVSFTAKNILEQSMAMVDLKYGQLVGTPNEVPIVNPVPVNPSGPSGPDLGDTGTRAAYVPLTTPVPNVHTAPVASHSTPL
jgi:hypothetical protein